MEVAVAPRLTFEESRQELLDAALQLLLQHFEHAEDRLEEALAFLSPTVVTELAGYSGRGVLYHFFGGETDESDGRADDERPDRTRTVKSPAIRRFLAESAVQAVQSLSRPEQLAAHLGELAEDGADAADAVIALADNELNDLMTGERGARQRLFLGLAPYAGNAALGAALRSWLSDVDDALADVYGMFLGRYHLKMRGDLPVKALVVAIGALVDGFVVASLIDKDANAPVPRPGTDETVSLFALSVLSLVEGMTEPTPKARSARRGAAAPSESLTPPGGGDERRQRRSLPLEPFGTRGRAGTRWRGWWTSKHGTLRVIVQEDATVLRVSVTLASGLDPDAVVVARHPDGSEVESEFAPLAQDSPHFTTWQAWFKMQLPDDVQPEIELVSR